jgi:tetratricopeptide (TPR) repeat protein/O-antigen ligase
MRWNRGDRRMVRAFRPPVARGPNLRFVLWQTGAFLPVCYFALIGGSFGGILSSDARLFNLGLVSLLVILWAISWARRGFPFPRTRLDLAWLAFVLAQVLAVALSTDPRRGVTPLALTLLYPLLFYLVVDVLRHHRLARLLNSTLLLVSVPLVLAGLAQVIGWHLNWWRIGGWEHILPPATVRIRSIAPHANLLAAYLNLLLPFGVVAWVRARGRLARVVLTVWLAAMLALLFFTSSRGGWLGTGGALLTMAGLFALDRRSSVAGLWRRLRARPVCLVVAGLLAIGVLVAVGMLLARQVQHPSHGPVTSARQNLWRPVWLAFAQSPLWGTGPATYVTRAMQTRSIPPRNMYPHAHSYPLHVLLESGLVGVLALGAFTVAVLRSALSHWRSGAAGARAWLIAAVAALAATAIHSLVDTPQTLPGFSFLIVLILAALERPLSPPRRVAWGEGVGRAALGSAWVMLIGALAVGSVRYAEYARGVDLANAEQYGEAALVLDRVAEQDADLASNWFQAGYVHAQIGFRQDDAAQLRQAVEAYRAGLALEPDFAVNWVQLGVLLWRTGDERGAREALQQAVERAPDEATFHLTWGAFEEAVGNSDRARELYLQGLKRRPAWAGSFFFRASPLREDARAHWIAEGSAPLDPLGGCWQLLDAGEAEGARRCFSEARELNAAPSYHGMGVAEMAAGELEQGEWHLRVAIWMNSDEARLAMGDLRARQGDLASAARWYERGLARKEPSGVTVDYTNWTFNREAIQDRYLPGVVWVAITDEEAERWLQLGAWYEQLGRSDDAIDVYQHLLKEVPDMAAAEERLGMLTQGSARRPLSSVQSER